MLHCLRYSVVKVRAFFERSYILPNHLFSCQHIFYPFFQTRTIFPPLHFYISSYTYIYPRPLFFFAFLHMKDRDDLQHFCSLHPGLYQLSFFIIYFDPSGVVTSAVTGSVLPGSEALSTTVTVQTAVFPDLFALIDTLVVPTFKPFKETV